MLLLATLLNYLYPYLNLIDYMSAAHLLQSPEMRFGRTSK